MPLPSYVRLSLATVALITVFSTVQLAAAQDAPPAQATLPALKTPAQLTEQAWTILTTATADDKHTDQRVQALAAIGLLQHNDRAARLLHTATSDHDVDVRTAAVIAAGQIKVPSLDKDLYDALGDAEPQVAFNAALVLAAKKDPAGDETLMAVIGGGATGPSMMGGAKHSMMHTIHHPATLARMGAMQGAGMILGPFGMGIGAVEYLYKSGSNPARVAAVDALAAIGNRSPEVHDQFLEALMDKDPGLRVAALKALSPWHDSETAAALANLFDDSKAPVRYTAAAAYLISTGAGNSAARTLRRTKKS